MTAPSLQQPPPTPQRHLPGARAWSETELAEARRALVGLDPALAAIDAITPPFTWRARPSGYAGLLWLIVGQQVSTASAAAVWPRLEAVLGEVTPASVLAGDDATLRAVGFSRQKIAYARALAEQTADYAAVSRAEEAEAMATLTGLKGVGRWTAESYLMSCEGRADLFPAGDIALQEVIRWIDGLEHRPDEVAARARAQRWAPWRSVAAHLLWAHYVAVKAGEQQRVTAWRA